MRSIQSTFFQNGNCSYDHAVSATYGKGSCRSGGGHWGTGPAQPADFAGDPSPQRKNQGDFLHQRHPRCGHYESGSPGFSKHNGPSFGPQCHERKNKRLFVCAEPLTPQTGKRSTWLLFPTTPSCMAASRTSGYRATLPDPASFSPPNGSHPAQERLSPPGCGTGAQPRSPRGPAFPSVPLTSG